MVLLYSNQIVFLSTESCLLWETCDFGTVVRCFFNSRHGSVVALLYHFFFCGRALITSWQNVQVWLKIAITRGRFFSWNIVLYSNKKHESGTKTYYKQGKQLLTDLFLLHIQGWTIHQAYILGDKHWGCLSPGLRKKESLQPLIGRYTLCFTELVSHPWDQKSSYVGLHCFIFF